MDATLRQILFRGVAPTWSYDFARALRAPNGATYTGNSGNGTYVNSAGVITASTNNSPRFDYDPSTLSPLGYLAEMASTNAIIRSGDQSNAAWTATNLTVTGNSVVAPDGTTTAATLTEDSANTAKRLAATSTSFVSGSTYGFSIFVKNISGSRWLQIAPIGGNLLVNFQPSTGTIGSTGGSNVSARNYGNGWYRIQGQFTSAFTGGTSNLYYMVSTSNAGAGANYTGDGTSAIAVWGAQQDSAGVGVTSYIPTAGSTVTRAQDVLSLPLTSLPGWSATQGGVLVAAYRLHTKVTSNNQTPLYLNDGDTTDMVLMVANNGGSGAYGGYLFSGNVEQTEVFPALSSALFARGKQALGWGTSRFGVAIDGGAVSGTSGSYALPIAPTTLNIGNYASGLALNGTLESIAYYRGARSDAFVQAVSR